VEQELNTVQQLAALIANPGAITGDDASVLRLYAERYPYFQPLHVLLAKANSQEPDATGDLATAALYNNGSLLHQMLYSVESLGDASFNIVTHQADRPSGNEPEALDENGIDEVSAESDTSRLNDEQEVFDEITEFNIEAYRQHRGLTDVPEPETLQLTHETLETEFETLEQEDEPAAQERNPEDDLVLENIVSTDFFAFQDNFDVEDVLKETPEVEEYSVAAEAEQAEQVVSKYDDDRLPYSFLWWLAKTRKEHEQIFQPYASPMRMKTEEPGKPASSKVPRELQQQYVENIFHMQSAFTEAELEFTASNLKRNSKGDEIIESFIKNEPQISPPKPEKINIENKAKKSAEDHSDLVSETLAKIYIEQMLYDKAIETYEKLSLMFPEKSRYFADLIQSIEKKI